MSLEKQREELVAQGYKIVSSSDDRIIGVRSKWHPECVFAKLTWVVSVRRVGTLTAAEIEADRERLEKEARTLDPSLLPRGFQKGVAVMAVYLAATVEPAARALCVESPRIRFAWFYLPAVLDESTSQASYLRTTPMWGALFFGKFRHLIRRLIEPAGVPAAPPLSIAGAILTTFLLIMFAVSLARIFGWR